MITLGDQVVLAPGVQILAHDSSLRNRIGFTKIKHVTIGNRVFIGAGSIVLPGVAIGDDVVIGAGSVVSNDIPSDSLALGHPARVLMPLREFEERERALLDKAPRYNEATPGRPLSMEERIAMRNEIPADGFGWGA
jgi:maltose O-acetyltransferase